MTSFVRRHLGAKLFLSYLVVIVIGVIVLATAAELAVPSTFSHHLAVMGTSMSSMMGNNSSMMQDLYDSFRSAVSEALLIATLSAAAVAVLVSLFVSRQVVAPVQGMMRASQRIAQGKYEERVEVDRGFPVEDLDELGRLAVSFNRMADSLEKTEAMRRQLIGDVTHELRTPLTTIKGYMEGLMDGVLPPNEETYQVVYQEADRLKRLVDDLQELSRVEAGAYSLNRRPIEVGGLVATLVERIAPQFASKNVALQTQIEPGLPPIYADEDRILQVLTNLTGNALQYTPAGGSVNINARLTGKLVEISVADTGIGIQPEHLEHIFTRFYRVDKSRARAAGGSGIGLTISRFLVEAHGGQIRAESSGPGQGSVFTFTVPAVIPG